MAHLHLKLAQLFVLLCVMDMVSSMAETWFNCTQPSCKSFLAHSPCRTSSCSCGVSTNQSTCSIPPTTIANQTGASNITNQTALDCCLCASNNTFCCKKCSPITTVQPTTLAATTAPLNTAYLQAAFITDCNNYISKKTEMTTSFKPVISNLAVIDVINITCSAGLEPFCGVEVSGLNTQGQAVGSVQCNSMLVGATLKSTPVNLRNEVEKIRQMTQAGNLTIQLWDGTQIKVSFLISRYDNTSYVLHKGPLKLSTTQAPPKTVPPIITNLWPLIYAGIGVGSFILLCIFYQCVKQSYYLRRKKFTNVNSNRINSRKKKVDEAMENKETTNKDEIDQVQQTGFDMTRSRLPSVDNELLTRQYDWTTPAYLPSMLAPAYQDTNGLNSPPRLMLDDGDSDGEKRSIGKSSVVNVDEESDDDLREILESDDEEHRPNTRQSYLSKRKSLSIPNNRKYSTASRTSQAKSNGSATSAKIDLPSNGRKASYGGTDGKRSPRPSFGNIKANRITPINNVRKPSVSSLKPRKTNDSTL